MAVDVEGWFPDRVCLPELPVAGVGTTIEGVVVMAEAQAYSTTVQLVEPVPYVPSGTHRSKKEVLLYNDVNAIHLKVILATVRSRREAAVILGRRPPHSCQPK